MGGLANNYFALGRYAEALKLYEETLALIKAKLGTDHRDTPGSMGNLADSYRTDGRVLEALPLLAKCPAANPKNTMLSLKVAALQGWFGQDRGLAATRQRTLANAEGTEDAAKAERTAKVCSFLPPAGKVELDASILLARRAVYIAKGNEWLDFSLIALGMAEYRSGRFAEADASLTAAMDRAKGHSHHNYNCTHFVTGTSIFYRAMSLFRQGKNDQFRRLATEAAAKMKPLPADEQNPTAGGAEHDDLILWLAYKEAKAMIGFDAPPAASAQPAGR
jgi:tetratricopeptide (TPR) repeat protein